MLRSQAGDRRAFEELVRRTARGVYARMYVETGNRERAEDLVQETYLVAWRSIGQVVDVEGFRAWLTVIGKSVRIDAARREGRKKRAGSVVSGRAMEEVADRGDGPAERMEKEEERQRVLAMVRELPGEYREVVAMRYLGGVDYEGIGKQLGITNGSLRGLLNRGMAMLRERVRIEEIGDRR